MINIEKEILNVNYQEVVSLLSEKNITYRLVRKDRDNFFLSQDLNLERINLSIDNNIVTDAYFG